MIFSLSIPCQKKFRSGRMKGSQFHFRFPRCFSKPHRQSPFHTDKSLQNALTEKRLTFENNLLHACASRIAPCYSQSFQPCDIQS
jgi:hypothetical protein